MAFSGIFFSGNTNVVAIFKQFVMNFYMNYNLKFEKTASAMYDI